MKQNKFGGEKAIALHYGKGNAYFPNDFRIPFTVKHITKCLCFRLKNKYKFSMVTITFVE